MLHRPDRGVGVGVLASAERPPEDKGRNTNVMHTSGLSWMDPNWLLASYGSQMFWISAAIIFVECGLFFPILPGDTLLFAVGMFVKRAESGAAGLDFPLWSALLVLTVAAFLGNVVGYEIGRKIGPALYNRTGGILRQSWFDQTTAFFENYGSRALILGRFVPIVRTFITLVAGVGGMDRRRFLTYSAVGAVLWAVSITLLGYFLGSIEFLQKNIEAAILVLVVVSVLPAVFEWWRHRRKASRAAADA